MSRLLLLLGDLPLLAFGVYCLLLAYRRLGKPPGADEKYDAWHRQWAGILKVLGWGWVVVATLGLIGTLAGLIGNPAKL